MYIYTIGAITQFVKDNELDKAIEWREELASWTKDYNNYNNIKIFNPVKTFLKERNYNYANKIIVDQNEYYINKSDIAIVNLEKIDYSPGSIYELTRFKMQNKPVIAIGEKHWSPHIDSCISQYCRDVNAVIKLLENMFSQNSYN